MTASTAQANAILDRVYGAQAYTPPATYYIGLSSTLPTNTGGNVTEPTGGAYARVSVVNNDTNFPNAANRLKSNGVAITFPVATADWLAAANLTHAVFYDAAAAGNFLGFGTLAVPKPVLEGDEATIPIGGLDITL